MYAGTSFQLLLWLIQKCVHSTPVFLEGATLALDNTGAVSLALDIYMLTTSIPHTRFSTLKIM